MTDLSTETLIAGPIGLVLRWGGQGLNAIDLKWSAGLTQSPFLSDLAQAVAGELDRYTSGLEPAWPELPFVWTRSTPFSRAVLHALKDKVPYGRTTTYGALAALAGRPGAARAVGRAMAGNPWPLIVPCHRVLGAGGAMTGFSSCGLPMKRALLDLEAAGRAAPEALNARP